MELFPFAFFLLFTLAQAIEHIIGGTSVDINQYPFAAAILVNGEFYCGGVIISHVTILTAAHCADGLSAKSITVRVGSSRHDTGGQLLSVSSSHIHPRYNRKIIDYDVATLTLSSSIAFSDTVSAKALDLLAPIHRPNAGTKVTAIGWGLTSENGDDSLILQAVDNVVVDQATCRARVAGIEGGMITAREICAQSIPVGKGVCPGDSGGALINSNTKALVGLTSFGVGCGAEYPSVFVYVGNLEIELFVEERLLLDAVGL